MSFIGENFTLILLVGWIAMCIGIGNQRGKQYWWERRRWW